MINVDDLLAPIADDKPCGEDFTYHPSFQNLETIFRGKPETQFGPGEEPQWKEVRDAALEVLGQSKHLAGGVILTVSLMKIGGLEGLRDGFAVVRGFTEKYWDDVYPRLDPDDNNDPTERLNILNNLSSSGEPYKFITHLKQIVLCDSSSMGRITFQQIIGAKEKGDKTAAAGSGSGARSGPDLNQIQAAFREAGPEAAATTLAFVNEVNGHAQAIESFLDSKLGSGKGVNFEALNKMLSEMKTAVEPYAGGASVESTSSDGTSTGGEAAQVAAGGGQAVAKPGAISSAIQTRGDVIRTLGLICDYYRDNEPSSPVPLILQRAERLVDKDFMTIMTDLTPDSLKQLEVITGMKPKEES